MVLETFVCAIALMVLKAKAAARQLAEKSPSCFNMVNNVAFDMPLPSCDVAGIPKSLSCSGASTSRPSLPSLPLLSSVDKVYMCPETLLSLTLPCTCKSAN